MEPKLSSQCGNTIILDLKKNMYMYHNIFSSHGYVMEKVFMHHFYVYSSDDPGVSSR